MNKYGYSELSGLLGWVVEMARRGIEYSLINNPEECPEEFPYSEEHAKADRESLQYFEQRVEELMERSWER